MPPFYCLLVIVHESLCLSDNSETAPIPKKEQTIESELMNPMGGN